MSQDFIEVSAIVSQQNPVDPTVVPKLIVYPFTQANGENGERKNALNSIVEDASQFSTNPFLFVYGDPGELANVRGANATVGDFATTFGGDVVIKGALFTNKLRDANGNLIDFSSIAYQVPVDSNFLAGATTAGQADGLLDTEIEANRLAIGEKANQSDLTTLTNRVTATEEDIGTLQTDVTDIQTDITEINAGTGLDNNNYVANDSTTYIKGVSFTSYNNNAGLTASLHNADFLLDQAIASVAGNIASINTQVALKASTADLSTLSDRVLAVETDIDGDNGLKARLTIAENTLSANVTLANDLNTKINNLTIASGLTDQTYTPALANEVDYITQQKFTDATLTASLFNADVLLDKAIQANKALIDNNIAAIEVNTEKVGITPAQAQAIIDNTAKNSISAEQAQAIIDNTEKVGISAAQAQAIIDNTAKNSISAEQAQAIIDNTEKVGISAEQAQAISTNTTDISNIEDLLDVAHVQSIGLLNTGVLGDYEDPKIIQNNQTIKDAIELLDAQVDSNVNQLTTNTTAIALNTAKVGITPAQAAEITANTDKVGITQAQADAITANTEKVGITPEQAAEITANTAKIGLTQEQVNQVAINTDKVGITPQQAQAISDNTDKVGITPEQAAAITANTDKVGITPQQAQAISDNTDKVGITPEQAQAISDNTDKVGITNEQAQAISTNTTDISGIEDLLDVAHVQSIGLLNTGVLDDYEDPKIIQNNQTIKDAIELLDAQVDSNVNQLTTNTTAIALNTAKVGITPQQAAAIVTNTDKVGITPEQAAAIVTNTDKVGITPEQAAAIVTNTNKNGITNEQAAAITLNTEKVGITQQQADAITANTEKVGITPQQADAITANTEKVGITPQQAADILTNTDKVGITPEQADAIIANTAKVGITQQQATAISTNTSDISDIETLLDLHESEIGLNNNGVLENFANTNFIQDGGTLKSAIELLDASLLTTNNNIQTNLNSINNLQSEIDATQTGAGLNANGSYEPSNATNFLQNATSLRQADFFLDDRIKANETAISNLGDLPNTVLQLGKLKTAVGTNEEGELIAFNGTNHLDGISIVRSALIALDTAISQKVSSVFDLTGIDPDDNTKQDGRILQYVAATDNEAEKFVYVDPGVGPQGPAGPQGIQGPSGTIEINSVATGEAGTDATVTNIGTNQAAQLDFVIPRGADGQAGTSATVNVHSVVTGEAGTDATITNEGTEQAAEFRFTIPRGSDGQAGTSATVNVHSVVTGEAGTDATVTNEGTEQAAEFRFTIPRGSDGQAGTSATVNVHSVVTGEAGTDATVTNEGTEQAAEFRFTIPRGADGQAGTSATVDIHSVVTGEAGTDATVTNEGTNQAAEFRFTIPRGADGQAGVNPTVDIHSVVTGEAGTDATVTNEGTDQAAQFRFTIPRGADGQAGTNATVNVHSVVTGEAGTDATVTNEGTAQAAQFRFTIPRGESGSQGPAGTISINSVTTGAAGTDASVANVGTAQEASLDIVIPRGDTGSSARNITGISIAGTNITTSFDSGDNIVSNDSFSASIGNLSDVDLTDIDTDKILKWDGQKFVATNDIGGGGGGGDITSVVAGTGLEGGSTSGEATINIDYIGDDNFIKSAEDGTEITVDGENDFLVLHDADDSGKVKYIKANQISTSGGTIGNAEDTDYTDGLFTDFTNATAIGTAIDRFNEVLKALAPTPAPDLDQFDVDTANSLLQNIKLSFGTSNDQSVAGTPYASVGNISGFDATDVNEIFSIESANGNYRKGVYTGSTSITGTLNEDVSNDTYTNNIVNYADNSFGNGDQGTLQLWLNGNKLDCDVDLSSDGAGDYLDADGSGFINLTAAISGKFSSDTEFPTFKHRQGEWKVDSASQIDGWNYAQVKHVIGESTKETGYAEWVNDSNNEAISVTNKSLSLNMAGSKYLSGIQYHTSGTATYTANIDNFYKYVYATDNMTFTESPDAIANFDSIAVTSIDTGNGEDHTKQINLSQVSNLLPINNRLLNQSLTAGFSLSHPIKANITTASTNETVTGILLDNVAPNSTFILDSFNDEQYRQTEENAYTQANLINNNYNWDSTESLVGADSGHNTGLIVYNSRLYSPKNNDLPNSGNFSTLSSSYANPNYSTINDNDVKVWIRKFKNNSGNTVKALLFSMSKNSSDIVNSNAPNNDEINVQFKIASKPGDLGAGIPFQEESAWLNVTEDFDLAEYLLGTITGCGDSTHNGNDFSANTINNKLAILKTAILDDEYVLVKITASADWSGYVDSINVNFVDVIGNVVNAPEVEHIDLEQTGVTGKLSFGATNTINNFTNYTTDINTLFDLSGDKSGIFDSTQTVTGFINDLTNSNGNNYAQYAFGGGESHKGTLKLHVNGQDIHTINLATRPYLTGNQLNNNGSGFTNLTSPTPARDANNRPDFDSVYRTSKFVITPTDQRLGYNFAKVIHVTDDGDEESNTIEWINDNNTDAPDFTDNGAATYSIDSAQISSTETNSLSGIAYYKKVTNVPYEISVKNMYKNIYSSASDAVLVSDADNNSKIKSISLEGINNNAITNAGSHTLPGNSRSGSKALPAITALGDESEVLKVISIFEVNYVKSILDLDAVDNYANMNDITINTTVKHPLNAANGETTSGVNETATSNKFLQYTVSTDNQSLVEEDFSNETRRLLSSWADANDNQAAASGSVWDSTAELTDGLMMYDDKLRYPDGDFRDENVNIHAPVGNPNYTGSTGTKSFYRIFQNTTQNAKTGFSLQLQGNGSVIVDPDTAFSATNIKIAVKIPETGDAQLTGYLNIAKAFETGQYNDGDGSLSGNLSNSITNGQTTTNTITFGQKFLQPNEYFVLKLEANENWTGYLSNITVDWS